MAKVNEVHMYALFLFQEGIQLDNRHPHTRDFSRELG